MLAKTAFLVSALGLMGAMAPGANASSILTTLTVPPPTWVTYSLFNPMPQFTVIIGGWPSGLITSDTTFSGWELVPNPEAITSVDFIIASQSMPGDSELDVFFASSPEQVSWLPEGEFAEDGAHRFVAGSFGYPNSYLLVAAPEPSTMALVVAGLVGLLGLHRRGHRKNA
jgi:PEP-CTERM motif